jgi:hypothetical protein
MVTATRFPFANVQNRIRLAYLDHFGLHEWMWEYIFIDVWVYECGTHFTRQHFLLADNIKCLAANGERKTTKRHKIVIFKRLAWVSISLGLSNDLMVYFWAASFIFTVLFFLFAGYVVEKWLQQIFRVHTR